jgi:RNA polymerase sigma-70 factor (ECF subfamily)
MRAEDRAVVERMQAGDREAFGEIYQLYARRVYAFALRRLRDPDEAEDICQDVFVEVARSIRSFQGRSALGTWILGIAFHEVCNRRRRFRRQPVSLDAQDGEAPAALEAPLDQRVDAVRTLARCAEVLGREIGPAHREMFELQLGGAADVATIAEAVGKSRQAVKISLFRTRRQLHARVAGLSELLASA